MRQWLRSKEKSVLRSKPGWYTENLMFLVGLVHGIVSREVLNYKEIVAQNWLCRQFSNLFWKKKTIFYDHSEIQKKKTKHAKDFEYGNFNLINIPIQLYSAVEMFG